MISNFYKNVKELECMLEAAKKVMPKDAMEKKLEEAADDNLDMIKYARDTTNEVKGLIETMMSESSFADRISREITITMPTICCEVLVAALKTFMELSGVGMKIADQNLIAMDSKEKMSKKENELHFRVTSTFLSYVALMAAENCAIKGKENEEL